MFWIEQQSLTPHPTQYRSFRRRRRFSTYSH